MKKKVLKLYSIPFKTIRMNMIFLFTVLILSVLFLFWYMSMTITKKAVIETSTEYTKQLIDQVNHEIDGYITNMENISTLLVANMDIRDYLHDVNVGEDELLVKRILSQFETILNMRDDIYNIGIFGENGKYLLNKGNSIINPNINFKDLNWYRKALENGGKRVLSSSHVQNIITNNYKWVVTLSKAIHIKNTDNILGSLLIDLNYSSITKLCEKITLGNKGYIFLIDESGDIIYHPKQQLVYTGIKREKIADIVSSKSSSFITTIDSTEKLYTMSKSSKTGWIVVGVVNTDELFVKENETLQLYSIVAFLLISTSILIAILYSNRITIPLIQLKNSMKEVERGNFIPNDNDIISDNEIGQLQKDFNVMTRQINQLLEDKVMAQREKRKLEMKSLYNQINPHFLYNTLDSIIWMAEVGNSPSVVTMTSSLSKLLRQNISNQDEFTTLGQEIESISSYLTIQKMRYQDKLTSIIDVPNSIYHYKLVKLILQPFVENAIYHGIKHKEGIGTIIIKGEEYKDQIKLQVIDNGSGIIPSTLLKIKEQIMFPPNSNHNNLVNESISVESHNPVNEGFQRDKKSHGIAIENVNRRLSLYYDDRYTLSFESELYFGTVVTIILPREKGGMHNETKET